MVDVLWGMGQLGYHVSSLTYMDRLDSISLYLLINEDGPSINQHSMTVDMSNIHKEGILPSTLQVRSV